MRKNTWLNRFLYSTTRSAGYRGLMNLGFLTGSYKWFTIGWFRITATKVKGGC